MENEAVDFDFELTKPVRPTFLTVLCVLTFIASAYYFFSSVAGFFIAKSFDSGQWESITEQMAEGMSDADESTAKIMEKLMGDVQVTMEKTLENSGWLSLVSLMVALVSAYGAYEMFHLRRRGFSMYVAAKFAGLVLPLVIIGFNIVTGITSSFALLFGLFFIALYAMNRKHMR